jgi:hypothetical protein
MQGSQVLELMERLLSHTWTLAVPAVGHPICRITLRPYPSRHTVHLTPQTVSGWCGTDHDCFLQASVNYVAGATMKVAFSLCLIIKTYVRVEALLTPF